MMIELTDVQEHGPDHLLLTTEVTDDAGNTVRTAHFMPKDAAEWRVAEYDLDPEDHDTLIDVLLWEAHVHGSGELDHTEALHLAPTRGHAREALLGAVRARKGVSDSKRKAARGKKKDGEPAVRKRVKDLFLIEPEVVHAKRKFVDMVREDIAANGTPEASIAALNAQPTPSLAADRAAVYHHAIALRRGSATDANDPA